MSIRSLRNYYWYLSGEAQYLFIHIPKNAGVTIQRSEELRGRIVPAERLFHKSFDYSRRLLKAMRETGDHHGFQHARLIDIAPRVRNRLQPIAVVRNPWARVVSRFTYAQRAMEAGTAAADYAPRSFEAFVEERHVWGGRDFFWHRAVRGWFPQVDYVTDEAGRRPVHILRAEFLDDEAARYFRLTMPIGRRNVSNTGRDYRSFYDEAMIRKIADWYAADIKAFGFDFDSPARRGYYFETCA
jgi:hypothetical protein